MGCSPPPNFGATARSIGAACERASPAPGPGVRRGRYVGIVPILGPATPNPNVMIQVRLFALARQAAGTDVVEIHVPDGATVAHVRRALAERHPALAPLVGQMLFAVDGEYASDGQPIPVAGEVACIPPVSGGAGGEGASVDVNQ